MAFNYERLPVTNTVGTLTPEKYRPSNVHAKYAFCIVMTAPINVLWTGQDPSTAEGIPYNPYDMFILEGLGDIQNLKYIRSGGSDGELRVVYG